MTDKTRAPNDETWPKALPKKSKRETAWKWAPLVTALTTLALSAAGYLDNASKANEAKTKAIETQAKNSLQLEAAYNATREAVQKLQEVEEQRSRDVGALREAIAEVRGAVEVLAHAKPGVTAATVRASRALDAIGPITVGPPPAPAAVLPEKIPEPTKAEVAEKIKATK